MNFDLRFGLGLLLGCAGCSGVSSVAEDDLSAVVTLRGTVPGTHEPDLSDEHVLTREPSSACEPSVLTLTVHTPADWQIDALGVVPVLATIEVLGDQPVTLEVSQAPTASVNVPCAPLRITVGWDQYGAEAYGLGANKLFLPGEVEVTVRVAPGHVDGAFARRFIGAPGSNVFEGPVPPFAEEALPFSDAPGVYGSLALFEAMETGGAGGNYTTLDEWTGPTMAELAAQGTLIALPALTAHWLYSPGPIPLDAPTAIEFAIPQQR